MTTYTPDVQGRGAWTRVGGLLPGRPASTSSFGYYRLPVPGELLVKGDGSTSPAYPVGSTWPNRDPSDAARAVKLGVKAFQFLFGLPVAEQDGWWGNVTDRACRAKQAALDLDIDGICGPATARAVLKPWVTRMAMEQRVPVDLLGGMVVTESMCDPGAVGYTTSNDHGLVQINLRAHPEITYEQAMDPAWVLTYAAKRMRLVFDKYVRLTEDLRWEVAVLQHNSPANAQKLATTGIYPTQQSREYVQKVMTSW